MTIADLNVYAERIEDLLQLLYTYPHLLGPLWTGELELWDDDIVGVIEAVLEPE